MKIFFQFGLRCFQLLQRKQQLLTALCEQFTCGEEIIERNVV